MPDIWEWEDLDYFFDPRSLVIVDSGPLLSPVLSFRIYRNDKNQLLLDTVSAEDPERGVPDVPAGTVRKANDTVAFVGRPELRLSFRALAKGLIYSNYSTIFREFDRTETKQTSFIQSIYGIFQEKKNVAYTVEWIDNLDQMGFIWTGGSVITENDIVAKRTIKSDDNIVELIAKRRSFSSSNNCLRLVLSETVIYLCATDRRDEAGKRHCANFILYIGEPKESQRDKIRDVLSFCLGKYINCFGYITIDADQQPISAKAQAIERFGRDAAIYPALPPAPLHKTYNNEVHQDVINRMANAILEKYEELDFSRLSWSYWHALIAPVHMAAAHYGAVLENIQRLCTLNLHLSDKLLPDEQWKRVKTDLLQIISRENINDDLYKILVNKISNLNQAPQNTAMASLLLELGLDFGITERKAWKRRNVAAHGAPIEKEDFILTIRETKILRILLHRIIIAFTNASDFYYDYYTINFPIRKLRDAIPTE